jgi:hypothetical protein
VWRLSADRSRSGEYYEFSSNRHGQSWWKKCAYAIIREHDSSGLGESPAHQRLLPPRPLALRHQENPYDRPSSFWPQYGERHRRGLALILPNGQCRLGQVARYEQPSRPTGAAKRSPFGIGKTLPLDAL